MNALGKRLIALGASSVIAVSATFLVAPFEGKENKAYLDLVGIPTICFGQIEGVKLGDYKTDAQCEESLAKELSDYNKEMKKYVTVSLPENMEVAYTSFVWNVGLGAWKNSTLLKKLNSKDYVGACQQLLRWDKAGGKTVKGLTNRRQAEYKVCMGKDADVNKALQELKKQGYDSLDIGED